MKSVEHLCIFAAQKPKNVDFVCLWKSCFHSRRIKGLEQFSEPVKQNKQKVNVASKEPAHSLHVAVLLAQVAEHVTVVTVHISTENLDAVLRTELVDPNHQVSGATCQTHLGEKLKGRSLESGLQSKATGSRNMVFL